MALSNSSNEFTPSQVENYLRTENPKKRAVREAAEASLVTFIALVHPGRVLGGVHAEYIAWLTRHDRKSHQLGLLPRDHQKSAIMAYRVAWTLAKYPHYRFLYLSSTSNLAQKQLAFIKDILTSPVFKYYWPHHVQESMGKRIKWSETEIALDHPKRKSEYVRDPSIFTAGLTTDCTGMHFDVVCADDVVVDKNAFTMDGRRTVANQMSYMASITGTEGELWSVGTRYFATDYYHTMLSMTYEIFDDEGMVESEEPLYEVFMRKVENSGAGVGEFLWPRQQREDGTWFGFNREILAKKRAQYDTELAFRSQYYNETSSRDGSGIVTVADFQYYSRENIYWVDGFAYYKRDRLNVFAAVDFAYTTSETADYTAIVIVGVDAEDRYFVLDIDRFKTKRISTYYEHLISLHAKWGFKKLYAEVVAAQSAIVEDLKENYVKKFALGFTIEAFKVHGHSGKKRDRILSTLEPKYRNGQIFHYRGGNTDFLEDELTSSRPTHDDCSDALANVIEKATKPSRHNPFARMHMDANGRDSQVNPIARGRTSRFGSTRNIIA